MRVYKQYRFFVGTKIPFSDWPALVDHYLDALGLQYQNFYYHFEDLDFSDYYRKILNGDNCTNCQKLQSCESCRREAQQGLKRQSACQRILKDCPALGSISTQTDKGFTSHIISNQFSPSKDAHDLVLPLMPKIHRSYGFSETYFCYHGINFFSRSQPYITASFPGNLEDLMGASIILRRWSVFPQQNSIILNIDITDDDSLLDASPYFEAMAALLPCARHMDCIVTDLTPQEKAELDEIEKKATPAMAAASYFFTARFADPLRREGCGTVSLTPALKRLGRQYSYQYKRSFQRFYFLEKQTANGHFISLAFDTGRAGDEVNVLISMDGLGFSQRIASICYLPENQRDAISHLQSVFFSLSEAEESVLSELDRAYPPSPKWYASARA